MKGSNPRKLTHPLQKITFPTSLRGSCHRGNIDPCRHHLRGSDLCICFRSSELMVTGRQLSCRWWFLSTHASDTPGKSLPGAQDLPVLRCQCLPVTSTSFSSGEDLGETVCCFELGGKRECTQECVEWVGWGAQEGIRVLS